MGPKEAKEKAARFCAYQERTQSEVRKKLLTLGLGWEEAEEVLSELIMEGFVNEERYAKSFAGGRFRLKKWGRLKIELELKKRGLTDYCIQKGMEEIDPDEYESNLRILIQKKTESLKGDPHLKIKLVRFLAGKGYEYDLINSLLDL